MANKNFQNYAIAGNNVALTYDNVNDTVTFDVNVDKNDVGLGNVDNTSDIDKPISTLVQNALNLKEGVITAGTTAQYYRGDKTFQTLDKTAVGLSNVDNTSDANKPISNATQTALNGKQATISLTTTGSSGASTFAANVLNIPTYTLSGLGGQPLNTNLTSISALTFASTSFVKMTAAGTFALDTNTYLTAETDTLASVTGRGNSTTNAITVGGLIVNTSSLIVFPTTFNVGINQSTDAGFRLDVNGTARIQGNITQASGTTFNSAGNNINLRSQLGGGSGYVVDVQSYNQLFTTLNTQGYLNLSGLLSAAAGSGIFRPLNIAYTINHTGAQTGVATGIFLNATETALNGITHNLLDLQVGGSSKFSVTNTGTLRAAGTIYAIGELWAYNGYVRFSGAQGNGILQISNQAATDFNRIMLGGNTSAFPAIKRNGTAIDFRLADDTAYTTINTGNITATGLLTTTGSITAASAIARGVYMNQTLVASANNDVLVGLDINPTFTNGSFTGVTNYGARISGAVLLNTNNLGLSGKLTGGTTVNLLNVDNTNNILIGSAFNAANTLYYSGNNFLWYQYPSNVLTQRMLLYGATGNLVIQNGGTFTDAGYRLDVVGTARIQNVLTLGNLATDPTGANGMIYYNTTSNVFRKYINGAWANL